MIKLFLIVAALVLQAAYGGKKTRSCNAVMMVFMHSRDGYPWGDTAVLEAYSAYGKSLFANRARRKAKKNARECADKVWKERWRTAPEYPGVDAPPNRPTKWCKCSASRRECKKPNSVQNFDMPNIKCRIYDRVCEMKADQKRDDKPETATIKLQTNGLPNQVKGLPCLSEKVYSSNYVVPECSHKARGEVCFKNP